MLKFPKIPKCQYQSFKANVKCQHFKRSIVKCKHLVFQVPSIVLVRSNNFEKGTTYIFIKPFHNHDIVAVHCNILSCIRINNTLRRYLSLLTDMYTHKRFCNITIVLVVVQQHKTLQLKYGLMCGNFTVIFPII